VDPRAKQSARCGQSTTPIQLIAGGAAADLVPWTMTIHTGDMKGAGTDATVRFSVEYATGQVRPTLFVQACASLTSPVQQQKSQFIALITDASGRASRVVENQSQANLRSVHTTVTADCLLCLVLSADNTAGQQAQAVSSLGSGLLYWLQLEEMPLCVQTRSGGSALKSSSQQRLPSNPEYFERGRTDSFQVRLPAADLKTLTIRHDNDGDDPAWYLDYIKLQREGSNPIYFACYQWLRVCPLTCCVYNPSKRQDVKTHLTFRSSQTSRCNVSELQGWQELNVQMCETEP
jgi:hypothetical protein